MEKSDYNTTKLVGNVRTAVIRCQTQNCPKETGDYSMKRKLFLGIALLLTLASAFYLSKDYLFTTESRSERNPDGQQKPLDGHQKMLELLADINARVPDEHLWLGDSRARGLRADLASFPASGSPSDLCQLHFNLGKAELRLGRENEAIDQLTTAYRMISSPSVHSALGHKWQNAITFQLGVAYMRVAETQNCCRRNTPDSCILPIRGQGIHTNQEPSTLATMYYTEILENTKKNSSLYLQAQWLLNIAYMTLGDHPDGVHEKYLIPVAAFQSDKPFPRFFNISSRLGVDTFSLSGGAIADDFDGDGYLDLIVSTWDPAGQIRLFRNNQDGTFRDRTKEAGLVGIYGGLNLVQADYNNDGFPDFLALRGAWLRQAGSHPNSLIRNNGDGTFTDVTFAAGLGKVHYPTQTASWADYDNDGDLDLYVGNETTKGVVAPCQLFQNNGDGSFQDVATEANVTNDQYAKAVVWGDYDNDRWPDLFVSNFRSPNRLFHNNQDGTFTDLALQAGVTRPRASFPAWFWDFDNDGVLDLFVSSYMKNGLPDLTASYLGLAFEREMACLYRGDGRGRFEEVAQKRNLTRPTLPMGSNFGDLDGDGYLDFYLGTGDPLYEMLMPNVMYQNLEGKRFADVTTSGGFGHLQKGHAVVFADLDNDGDQDIFEQLGGAFPGDKFNDALYENPGFQNHWITIHVIGIHGNRSAIGARIRIDVVEDDTTRTIYKHVNSGGSFGANPLRQTIGLGRAKGIERLEIFWPTTGRTQTFRNIPMDQTIRIVEGVSECMTVSLNTFRLGFPDASSN